MGQYPLFVAARRRAVFGVWGCSIKTHSKFTRTARLFQSSHPSLPPTVTRHCPAAGEASFGRAHSPLGLVRVTALLMPVVRPGLACADPAGVCLEPDGPGPGWMLPTSRPVSAASWELPLVSGQASRIKPTCHVDRRPGSGFLLQGGGGHVSWSGEEEKLTKHFIVLEAAVRAKNPFCSEQSYPRILPPEFQGPPCSITRYQRVTHDSLYQQLLSIEVY